jgi:hypothetical protein
VRMSHTLRFRKGTLRAPHGLMMINSRAHAQPMIDSGETSTGARAPEKPSRKEHP